MAPRTRVEQLSGHLVDGGRVVPPLLLSRLLPHLESVDGPLLEGSDGGLLLGGEDCGGVAGVPFDEPTHL